VVDLSRNVRAFYVFFFSSRRRHTRSKRDWSSDVCSSDLGEGGGGGGGPKNNIHVVKGIVKGIGNHAAHFLCLHVVLVIPLGGERSEERRVGKECRWRWAREQ